MTDLKQYRITASSAAELVAPHRGRRRQRRARARAAAAVGAAARRRRRAQPGRPSPPALAELRRRGVVVTEPRRGTRIGAGPPIGSARAPLPVPPGARDLSRGNPDPALLPDLDARARALRACRRACTASRQALPELRRARARAAARRRRPRRATLCVVSGALDAIERVAAGAPAPGRPRRRREPRLRRAVSTCCARTGLALEPVAVDERGMLPDALRAALARGACAVVITPRGQNPTGAALDAHARARAAPRCSTSAPTALLIEDDHLGPVAGSALHTARSAAPARALGGHALGRQGARARPAPGRARRRRRTRSRASQGRQQCGPGWVSHILQALVLEPVERPATSHALVARASATYAQRRERLLACLARQRRRRARRLRAERVDRRCRRRPARRRAAAARLGARARRALPARRQPARRSASRPPRSAEAEAARLAARSRRRARPGARSAAADSR